MYRLSSLIAGFAGIAISVAAAGADIDWGKVDHALGKPGANQPGGVHKYGLPRSDLKIAVDGVAIKPALALGSWIAFIPMGSGAMFMGDLVLTDTEISPVMKRLTDDGIEITAVHNHLLRTSPAVFYMHVGGHGDPVKLAQTLHAGLALSQTPFAVARPRDGASDHRFGYGRDRCGAERQGHDQWRRVSVQHSTRGGHHRSRHGRSRPPWARRSPSIFSQPAEARRPSPAISCCWVRKSTRSQSHAG